MNDAVAKAFLRSKEARMIVASFLSEEQEQIRVF